MKYYVTTLVTFIILGFFNGCKKGNGPATQPPQDTSSSRLEKGRYIIRTKYVKCNNDSVAFALGLFSNFESLQFTAMVKGEDNSWIYDNENNVWNLDPVYQYLAFDPTKPPEEYGLLGYRIFKVNPADNVFHLFSMYRPTQFMNEASDGSGPNRFLKLFGMDDFPDNLIGIGGPLVFGPGENENNHAGHMDEYSTIFRLMKKESGNYRIINNRSEHVFHNWDRWKLTTTNDWAGGDCNNAQRATLRPESTGGCYNEIENGNQFRRCYIDEFVFEKVN